MNIPLALRPILATRSSAPARSSQGWIWAITFLLLAASSPAQQVVMTAPDMPVLAPVMRPANPEDSPSATAFQAFPTAPSVAAGEFKLRPHLLATVVHADGLPVQAAARVTSTIYTFSPGLLADLGPHWTIDYTATARNYSAKELRNSVDHDIRLAGASKTPDWGFQLTESYTVTSSILVETAQQTKQKIWANALSVEHKFGNLLRYQGTAGLTKSNTENLQETSNWETQHWMHSTVSPKVDAGIGFGLGYSDIVAQPNTYYEKYLAELEWRPANKINLSLQAGWEDWHSLSAAVGDQRNPVVDATLAWQPFQQTRIAFTEMKRTTNSIFENAVTESTGWSVTVNQRLLEKLILSLAYHDDSATYDAAQGNSLAGRSDKVKTFNASLSITLFQRWSVGATFQSSKNNSNQAAFHYSSTQYGLQLQGRF